MNILSEEAWAILIAIKGDIDKLTSNFLKKAPILYLKECPDSLFHMAPEVCSEHLKVNHYRDNEKIKEIRKILQHFLDMSKQDKPELIESIGEYNLPLFDSLDRKFYSDNQTKNENLYTDDEVCKYNNVNLILYYWHNVVNLIENCEESPHFNELFLDQKKRMKQASPIFKKLTLEQKIHFIRGS